MSVCGQSGQAEEDSATDEVAPSAPSATRDIYKQKPASKVVRVLTVLAYLLSVSLAAILLSVYYVCVWRSPELARDVSEASAQRDNRTQFQRYQQQQLEHAPPTAHADLTAHTAPTAHAYGGGDTSMNGTSSQSPPDNITGSYEDSATEPSADASNMTSLPDSTPELLNGSTEFSPTDST